jgi:H+/gluconate symporter-like permease
MEGLPGVLIFIGMVMFIPTVVVGAIAFARLYGKAEQFDRKRAIQKGMEQTIIDHQTEREHAEKLLKQSGQSK